MNDINKEIHRIIDTVIDCSKAVVSHEHMSVTKEEVMKKSKKENAFRVRCLIVYFLYKDGLSVTTMVMLHGDHDAVFDKYSEGDEEKYFDVCYDFAVSKLHNTDPAKWIRPNLGL